MRPNTAPGKTSRFASAFDAIGDPAYRIRQSDLLPPGSPERIRSAAKPSPKQTTLLRLVAFIGILAAVSAGLIIPLRLFGAGRITAENIQILERAGMLVGAIVAYLCVARFLEGRGWPVELATNRASGLLKGALLGAAIVLVAAEVLALCGGYTIGGVDGDYRPWLDLLSLGVIAAVLEELVFRGALLRYLEEWFGSWAALVLSALIFGFAHFGDRYAGVLPCLALAVSGLLLGALYLATRSLWWVIGFHLACNVVVGPLLGMPVTGSPLNGWLMAGIYGPAWLTGGRFGMEASVVLVGLSALCCAFLLFQLARSGQLVAPSWVRSRELANRAEPAATSVTAPTGPARLTEPATPIPAAVPVGVGTAAIQPDDEEESIATPASEPAPPAARRAAL